MDASHLRILPVFGPAGSHRLGRFREVSQACMLRLETAAAAAYAVNDVAAPVLPPPDRHAVLRGAAAGPSRSLRSSAVPGRAAGVVHPGRARCAGVFSRPHQSHAGIDSPRADLHPARPATRLALPVDRRALARCRFSRGGVCVEEKGRSSVAPAVCGAGLWRYGWRADASGRNPKVDADTGVRGDRTDGAGRRREGATLLAGKGARAAHCASAPSVLAFRPDRSIVESLT